MILLENVDYSSDSRIDPFGRVFYYNGQVYRAIYKNAMQDCLDLINSELFSELMKLHYVPKTKIEEDVRVDGFPLILHHEKCSIIKPYEWTFEMYKSVAEFILTVNDICIKYGYSLKDAHPFNITFNRNKPILFDIGSIEKKETSYWVAQKEFVTTIVLPLYLWRDGDLFILRAMLESSFMGGKRLIPNQHMLEDKALEGKLKSLGVYTIGRGNFSFSTKFKFIFRLFQLLDDIIKKVISDNNYQFTWKKCDYSLPSNKEIRNIDKRFRKSKWGNYPGNYADINFDKEFPRFKKIAELSLKYCKDADSMIDLAGNQGMFSLFMYNQNIYKAITLADYDENALNKGYLFFSKNNIPINVVWTNPIEPVNLDDVSKRIKADVVFALAVTHHLSLGQHYPFSVIFDIFKRYTNKYIVVEYMPLGLWDGIDVNPELPSWYNKDNFKSALMEHFLILHEEQLEENRIVFIGEKSK